MQLKPVQDCERLGAVIVVLSERDLPVTVTLSFDARKESSERVAVKASDLHDAFTRSIHSEAMKVYMDATRCRTEEISAVVPSHCVIADLLSISAGDVHLL
jgi:hypothetical protein